MDNVFDEINATMLRMRESKDSKSTIITDEQTNRSFLTTNIYIQIDNVIDPTNSKELAYLEAYLKFVYNKSLLLTKQEHLVSEPILQYYLFNKIQSYITPFILIIPYVFFTGLRRRKYGKVFSGFVGGLFFASGMYLNSFIEELKLDELSAFYNEEAKSQNPAFDFNEYLSFTKEKNLSLI